MLGQSESPVFSSYSGDRINPWKKKVLRKLTIKTYFLDEFKDFSQVTRNKLLCEWNDYIEKKFEDFKYFKKNFLKKILLIFFNIL